VLRQCGAIALVVLVAMFAACGGGGGGGGGSEGVAAAQDGAGTPRPAQGPTVSAAPDQTIVRERLQESEGFGALLHVIATGDVSPLQGQTIYVVIEDPASLFKPTPQIELHSDLHGAWIRLNHRPMDLPGRFQGELKVHVCLDAACGSELPGSPVKVPFDVIVRPGMTVDRDTIHLALGFGEVPPDQTIHVTLPPETVGEWSVFASLVQPNFSTLLVDHVQSTSPDARSGTLTLKVHPKEPGAHQKTYELSAIVRHSDGSHEFTRKTVTLRYDVARDERLYVFYPATGSYTKVFGDFATILIREPMVTGRPKRAVAVEYLSQPEAAKGHVLANSWYRPDFFSIIPCAGASPHECLPPGAYVARVHYQVEVGIGIGPIDAFWPVTFEVLPR
jgi:hypothetical protein